MPAARNQWPRPNGPDGQPATPLDDTQARDWNLQKLQRISDGAIVYDDSLNARAFEETGLYTWLHWDTA